MTEPLIAKFPGLEVRLSVPPAGGLAITAVTKAGVFSDVLLREPAEDLAVAILRGLPDSVLVGLLRARGWKVEPAGEAL